MKYNYMRWFIVFLLGIVIFTMGAYFLIPQVFDRFSAESELGSPPREERDELEEKIDKLEDYGVEPEEALQVIRAVEVEEIIEFSEVVKNSELEKSYIKISFGGKRVNKDFKQGVEFSHWLFSEHIEKGARVVDATVGRGRDTEFLAKLVGEEGFVWGFDIQTRALEEVQKEIKEKEFQKRVELINDGHENLAEYVDSPLEGIIFNLGYLPGSDKEIITHPKTTLEAVRSGLELLTVGGLIVLVVYLGHPGGKEEKAALLDYVSELDDSVYNVLHYHFINQEVAPPEILAIKKRG